MADDCHSHGSSPEKAGWFKCACFLAMSIALYQHVADAQEATDYKALWNRGSYREALAALDGLIAPRMPNVPSFWLKDRAELRFLLGDVDRAIEDYERLTDWSSEADDTVRLAELYRYRGRMDDFERTLKDAERRLQNSWNYIPAQDALMVAGRIAEFQGEDPKRVLSSVYGTLMRRAPEFTPAFVAAGNLALRKGSLGAAARYFEQALSVEPDNQEALAGLAATYWESRDERVETTLARLDQLNPNAPDGQAIRAEMLLDARKIPEALARIDGVLAVNPNHLRFRALKAAALFLLDDTEAMKALQAETLAFNPLCSDVYHYPGKIATRYYRFKEAETLQRQALDTNPQDHEARAELAINLLRLGKDDEAKKELDAAFAADPYNVTVFNSLKVLDTLNSFTTISQGPFELQLPKAEAPILGPAALNLLEEELGILAQKYELQVETPIRVQMFDHHDDFMVRSLGLPGNAGHLGICFGQLVTMDSPSARPKGSVDWQAVLWHEFAHVITLQKTRNRMPRWLSEGISVHEERLRSPGWGTNLDPAYRDIVTDTSVPGLSELEVLFTQPETPRHLMFGYFLAGEFVNFYTANYGDAAMVKALERIGQEEATLAALSESAGIRIDELDLKFREHLAERLAPLDQVPALAEAMRRGMAAMATQAWSEAETAFLEAIAVFPEYAGDDGPYARLAEVYEATGQHDKLEETLGKRLRFSTISLASWQRLAALRKDAGDWRGVMEAATGGSAVDPFDVNLGRLLLEAQRELDLREDALITAERLAALDTPHALDYRLEKARLLMKLERWSEAKRAIVMLLEDVPHYRQAQELLVDIVAQMQS